ncbi:MAG TPA: hypothetical protein VIM30_10475 [Candidatus Limnocylindrales bacterium]
MCKVGPPIAPVGRFSPADFTIDLPPRTVTWSEGGSTASETLYLEVTKVDVHHPPLGRDPLAPASASRTVE